MSCSADISVWSFLIVSTFSVAPLPTSCSPSHAATTPQTVQLPPQNPLPSHFGISSAGSSLLSGGLGGKSSGIGSKTRSFGFPLHNHRWSAGLRHLHPRWLSPHHGHSWMLTFPLHLHVYAFFAFLRATLKLLLFRHIANQPRHSSLISIDWIHNKPKPSSALFDRLLSRPRGSLVNWAN